MALPHGYHHPMMTQHHYPYQNQYQQHHQPHISPPEMPYLPYLGYSHPLETPQPTLNGSGNPHASESANVPRHDLFDPGSSRRHHGSNSRERNHENPRRHGADPKNATPLRPGSAKSERSNAHEILHEDSINLDDRVTPYRNAGREGPPRRVSISPMTHFQHLDLDEEGESVSTL